MLKLIIFNIMISTTSFIGGFILYWLFVDRVKFMFSIVVDIALIVLTWRYGFSLIKEDIYSILIVIIWEIFVIYVGFKVRTLDNKKIRRNKKQNTKRTRR